MLADATQGGIPLGMNALDMTAIERKAAIRILEEIRKEQEKRLKQK